MDQVSFLNWTSFPNTCSGRMPSPPSSSTAMRQNSAFFCSTVRVLFAVIWDQHEIVAPHPQER
jgi:hypothetical protein